MAPNTVCLVCGNRGIAYALNYCSICRVNAQHRYCFEKIPEVLHEEVYWVCKYCSFDNVIKTPDLIEESDCDTRVNTPFGANDGAKVDTNVPIDVQACGDNDGAEGSDGIVRRRVKHSAPRRPYKLPLSKPSKNVAFKRSTRLSVKKENHEKVVIKRAQVIVDPNGKRKTIRPELVVRLSPIN